MKKKISVTIEENNLYKIRESMTLFRYKNKSQAVAFHLKELLKDLK
jgi:Arc/MetJ-type ribon-helix-helix transcriptional regulator